MAVKNAGRNCKIYQIYNKAHRQNKPLKIITAFSLFNLVRVSLEAFLFDMI